MSRWVPTAVEADTRLRRVESLLDQALDDLTGNERSSLCVRCAAALAEAFAELQSFAALLTEAPPERMGRARLEQKDRVALIPRVKALLSRLNRVECLLAAAAEFYLGWCSVEPAPSYPSPAYQTAAWSHSPVLLALEC